MSDFEAFVTAVGPLIGPFKYTILHNKPLPVTELPRLPDHDYGDESDWTPERWLRSFRFYWDYGPSITLYGWVRVPTQDNHDPGDEQPEWVIR